VPLYNSIRSVPDTQPPPPPLVVATDVVDVEVIVVEVLVDVVPAIAQFVGLHELPAVSSQ
jgi:hypothetical protein